MFMFCTFSYYFHSPKSLFLIDIPILPKHIPFHFFYYYTLPLLILLNLSSAIHPNNCLETTFSQPMHSYFASECAPQPSHPSIPLIFYFRSFITNKSFSIIDIEI